MIRHVLNRWFRRSSRRTLSVRPRWFRPCVEPLEDRVLLDAGQGLPPAVVVGRTLSSYFAGSIQNNQETISYTVYNEQANPVSGVLLTDTLAPGVTIQSASQQPDQSGQDLAWSLGTIQGFDRASVTLTLALPSPTPLTLDSGAHTFAMLDAGAVSNSTPAATLRPGSVDPSLLASTPDANTTDPFVQEQAAKLNYDPQQIFAYLHNDIGYNSYFGSLRGARGTLWSSAGNALDVASLGVALMRASGIPAQYVSGTLSKGQAQQLILSMFPASYQTVGYIPGGTQTADPADDPQLLAETESHYWFRFDAGNGMVDADPLVAGATVGQTVTTSTSTFTEVTDSLREKTEIKLNAETYSQASATLAGNGLSTKTVLDQTFNDVDLVGRPITVGHFVDSSSIGGITFSSNTNTYSPFLALGDDAFPDPGREEIIRGQDYQEVFTNFPLGNQVVTGLFLDVTLSGPQGPVETYERALVDRIGYAERQGLVAANVSVDPTGPPALTDFDVFTLNALPSQNDPTFPRQSAPIAQQLEQKLSEIQQAGTNPPLPQAVALERTSLIALTRMLGESFLTTSDAITSRLGSDSLVTAYLDRPRLILVSHRLNLNPTTQTATDSFSIDLRRDAVRVVSPPGQAAAAARAFRAIRGISESTEEQTVLQTLLGTVPSQSPSVSDAGILQEAAAQGVPLILVSASTLSNLNGLAISAEAKARITAAVGQGLVVIVPVHGVLLNGVQKVAWYEVDPNTGNTMGETEDGGHEINEELEKYALVVIAPRTLGEHAISFVVKVSFIALLAVVAHLTLNSLPPYLAGVQAFASTGSTSQVAGLPEFGSQFSSLLEDIIQNPLPGAPNLVALSNPTPRPPFPLNWATADVPVSAYLSGGSVSAGIQTPGFRIAGTLSASWTANDDGSFLVTSLDAATASVKNANGTTVGSGAVHLAVSTGLPVTVGGNVSYSFNGQGTVAAYAPTTPGIGISADWTNYTATLSGSATLQLSTDGLQVNGTLLPAGTYTISTASASLSGSGPISSLLNSSAVAIQATNAVVQGSPGTETASILGAAVNPGSGFTLTGFNGTTTVTTANAAESIALSGSAANVLAAAAEPSILSTDQNHSVSFQLGILTSQSATYHSDVDAPLGWITSINASGLVTVTPPPGVQSGAYPIRLKTLLLSDPSFVTHTVVTVLVTPSQPSITLAVRPDSLFTVPYHGAQVPTAFQAVIHNTGPTADTYNLTFSNLPAGWTILNSGTSVTVPAGQTGILGIYLQPSGTSLPAPGTPISFTVTATSTTDPTITATQTVSFAMPVVDAVTVVSTPSSLSDIPGGTTNFTVNLQNVGNVPENVDPTLTLPAGLSAPDAGYGLFPVSLAVGQSVTEPVHLHADSSVALNSTLTATVTATYGPSASPLTQTLPIPVQIEVPGATALASAAITANQLGRTDLANRLSDLATALTNLVQDPTNAVFKSQALANLDSLIAQIANDPFLSVNTFNLPQARSAIAAATTAAGTQAAVSTLGGDLTFLSEAIADEAKYGFTLALGPNTAVAQPLAPVYFDVALRNVGTKPATYDFRVSGLPAGVTATFSQPSITLQPGQAIEGGPNGVTLALTETGNNLVATGFTVTVTAEQATEIEQGVPGTLTVRDNFVSVTVVDATPPFTAPGKPVDVTARVLNAVNQQQQALASFTVADAAGHVVFTSQPVPLTLTVQTALATVDLGSFDTTGLAPGSYSINVTVTDSSGHPIPGGTGQGSVLLGLPVTARLSVSPTTLPPGTSTVTNTLQLTSQTSFPPPLTLLGQVQTTPTSTTIALDGNLAYVAGTNGIDIVDISNPSSPRLLSTFGQNLIVSGGLTVVRLVGKELIVGSTIEYITGAPPPGFTLLIYSLADPLNPTLLSHTPIDYSFLSELLVQGNTVLVPTYGAGYFAGFLSSQFGSLLSLDVSNPASPALSDVLYNTLGAPYGGDTNQNGGAIVNDHLAYIASSTSTGSNSQSGTGRVLMVDYSNPTSLSVLGEVDIPGTVQVVDVAIQGNRALVVGSTGGWRTTVDNIAQAGLTGNLTFSVLDISNPLAPTVLGTTLVTDSTLQPVGSVAKISALPLGNGLFAVSEGLINGKPVLMVVDPSDPSNIVVTTTAVPALVNEMAVSNGLLYTTSAAGLAIYHIGSIVGDPVTVSVQVPNNADVSLVPGSFNSPPTQIIPGTSYNTLVWDRTLAFGESQPTFTWQTQVKDLQPGDVVPVTGTTTIDFVDQGAPGTLTLPPALVSGVHLVGLDPTSQTVQPGETATYDIRLQNTTAQLHDYSLQITGVPSSWVTLPAGIMTSPGFGFLALQPNSSVEVKLQLTSNASAVLGTYGFTVITRADISGSAAVATDTAQGTLTLAGQPADQSYLQAHGVVATLTPAKASAGQGTSATYTVQLVNTGSADETFSLAATLPSGVTGTFSQDTVDVPPGLSNFRDVTLTLTPQVGTTAGADPFSVTATSTTVPANTASATGTLTVLAAGVNVALGPSSAAPGSTFQMTVTNTGQATDTFDLSLASPSALVSTLGTNTVTLAAGASQVIPITTTAVNFATPGTLALTAIATSHTSPAVQASATTNLVIAASKGMTDQFNPATQILPQPGPASTLLQVQNTGNTEDAYTATITATTGLLTAHLVGLDGQPTQTIALFRLPGLSTGAIELQVNLASGTGTVTVQVTSLTDSSITATSTAQFSTVTGFEFTPLSGVTLGTFTQGDSSEPASNFHVTINWGDGSPSDTTTGQVSETAGAYTVSGGHTYTDESYQQAGHAYTVTAQVSDGTTAKTFTASVGVVEELLPDGTRGTANQRFIAEEYRDLLGRAVDAGGLQSWVPLLDAGVSRADVVRAIENAPGNEYRFHLVDQLYRQFLHRSSIGDGGAAGWVGLLAGGGTVEQVEAGIVGSPEYYQTRGGDSAAGWLNAVYQDLFQRSVDTAGQASWLGAASAGSLSAVALAILTAPVQGSAAGNEYRAHLVDSLYQQLLDRSSQGDAGAMHWLRQLQAGQRYEDVVAGIVGDPQEVEFFNKISS
jgi:uncharacterized membrane protein